MELINGTNEDEDDGVDGPHRGSLLLSGWSSNLIRRWVRVARCSVTFSGIVDGFNWVDGTREWKVEGKLADKVKLWEEEDGIKREEEEQQSHGCQQHINSLSEVDSLSKESEEDENHSEDIKALREQNRYLKSLLQSSKQDDIIEPYTPHRSHTAPKSGRQYSILVVVNTNILLSLLSVVSSLIESLRWTVVVSSLIESLRWTVVIPSLLSWSSTAWAWTLMTLFGGSGYKELAEDTFSGGHIRRGVWVLWGMQTTLLDLLVANNLLAPFDARWMEGFVGLPESRLLEPTLPTYLNI